MRKNRWKILLLALTIGAALLLWLNATTTNPVEALEKASALAKTQPLSEIEPLLKVAARELRLAHWTQLLRAQLLERDGKKDAAVAEYQQISATSAASLDAQVALLRLFPPKDPGQAIVELEASLPLAGRKDLLSDVSFNRAVFAERDGEIELAQSFYLHIREQFPRLPIAAKARDMQYELESSYQKQLQSNSLPALTREGQLLLHEEEFALALQKIEAAKALAPQSSEALFEALLIEEEILRKLNRNDEAEHVLLEVSADGTLNSADVALFRLAKNAWNINDQHRALTFIDNLKLRFPQSPLVEEAQYIEARILEELNLFPEAKDLYLLLSENSPQIKRRILALQRLAWMYMRSKSFSRAAEIFDKVRLVAEKALSEQTTTVQNDKKPVEEPLTLRSFNPEQALHHAMFWEGYCLRDATQSAAAPAMPNAEQLWTNLITLAPLSYYRILAEKSLPQAQASSNSSSGNIVPAAGSPNECLIAPEPALLEFLSLFDGQQVSSFAQREIDWYFFRHYPQLSRLLADGSTDTFPASDQLAVLLTKLQLSNRFGTISFGMELAERLLKLIATRHLSDTVSESCLNELKQLSFPRPFARLFVKASQKYQAPLALLYAIARTESHFNLSAVSPAGAVGIMQLLPTTAKEEGAEPDANLLDPQTNLFFGAKHFSHLLSLYDNQDTYAISAYNAGSSAVNRWRSREQNLDPMMWVELISYPETKDYVKQVLAAREVYEKLLESGH